MKSVDTSGPTATYGCIFVKSVYDLRLAQNDDVSTNLGIEEVFNENEQEIDNQSMSIEINGTSLP